MAGYPKIWTTLLGEEWYRKLTCLQRGVWFQFILLAKHHGDTGRFFYSSLSHLAHELAVDRGTLGNVLRIFQQRNIILLTVDNDHTVGVEVLNYLKWQGLTPKQVAEISAELHHPTKPTRSTKPEQSTSAEADQQQKKVRKLRTLVKMTFIEWKSTPKAQAVLNGMKSLYSVETIRAEVEKLTARFAGETKAAGPWTTQVQNWFKNKPKFDAMRPSPITAAEESDHYASHQRSSGGGDMTKASDILKEFVK